jgi:hypothetical protein
MRSSLAVRGRGLGIDFGAVVAGAVVDVVVVGGVVLVVGGADVNRRISRLA